MRRWLCSSLVGGLLLCGGCGAPTSVGFIAKVPAVALIVGSELDPYEAALVSSARCEAKTSKVRLVVTMPASLLECSSF